MKNKIVIGVIGAIVIVGASFYAGIAYGKSSTGARGQFMVRTNGAGSASGVRGGMNGDSVTLGEIIAKDATSITVKLPEGGSKIVLIASSTQVMKTTAGSLSDLTVGATISAVGKGNNDGSVTGQSIQLRPPGSMSFGGKR